MRGRPSSARGPSVRALVDPTVWRTWIPARHGKQKSFCQAAARASRIWRAAAGRGFGADPAQAQIPARYRRCAFLCATRLAGGAASLSLRDLRPRLNGLLPMCINSAQATWHIRSTASPREGDDSSPPSSV